MKVIASLLLALGFAGCLPTASDSRLCLASGELVASINLVIRAEAADMAGDKSETQALASQASDQARAAHANLDSITAESVRKSTAWQSLLDAYLHAGQAANALLPGHEATYGMTSTERESAIQSLRQAGVIPGCALPSIDDE